jgi:hypothetical protein
MVYVHGGGTPGTYYFYVFSVADPESGSVMLPLVPHPTKYTTVFAFLICNSVVDT